jgi:hypothetical protein
MFRHIHPPPNEPPNLHTHKTTQRPRNHHIHSISRIHHTIQKNIRQPKSMKSHEISSRNRTHSHACLRINSSPPTITPDRTLKPLEHEFTSRPASRSQKYVYYNKLCNKKHKIS